MSKRQFAIVVVVSAAAAFAGAFVANQLVDFPRGPATTAEFTARAIHLVGASGTTRASFYLGVDDSPQLVFYDATGTNRASLGLAPAGNAGMSFNDAALKTVLDLSAVGDGGRVEVHLSGSDLSWSLPPARH